MSRGENKHPLGSTSLFLIVFTMLLAPPQHKKCLHKNSKKINELIKDLLLHTSGVFLSEQIHHSVAMAAFFLYCRAPCPSAAIDLPLHN